MVHVLVGGKKREDVLRDAKRRLEDTTRDHSSSPTTTINPQFSIEDHGTFWRIHGVPLRGDYYEVDHAKDLVRAPTGEKLRRTQLQWIEYTIQDRLRGPSTPAVLVPYILPVYCWTWETLRVHAQHPTYGGIVEQARMGIRSTLKDDSIITLSQILYNPPGHDDELLHYVDLPEPRKTPCRIAGVNVMGNLPESNRISALLTEFQVEELDRLTTWLFNRTTHLTFPSIKPDDQTTSLIQFGSRMGKEYACIDAINYPDQFRGPALGIRTRCLYATKGDE